MNIQESEFAAVAGNQRSSERRAAAPSAPERFGGADSTAVEARGAEEQVLGRAAVEKVLGDAQDELSKRGVALKFKLVGDANQYQVEVRDKNSDKIIHKLPPDEVVNLSKSLKDMAGAFLNKGI